MSVRVNGSVTGSASISGSYDSVPSQSVRSSYSMLSQPTPRASPAAVDKFASDLSVAELKRELCNTFNVPEHVVAQFSDRTDLEALLAEKRMAEADGRSGSASGSGSSSPSGSVSMTNQSSMRSSRPVSASVRSGSGLASVGNSHVSSPTRAQPKASVSSEGIVFYKDLAQRAVEDVENFSDQLQQQKLLTEDIRKQNKKLEAELQAMQERLREKDEQMELIKQQGTSLLDWQREKMAQVEAAESRAESLVDEARSARQAAQQMQAKLAETEAVVDFVRANENLLERQVEEQQQALRTMKEDMEREAGRFEVLTAPIHEQLHTQKLRISGLLFEAEKEQLARKAVERRNEFLESASAQLTETVKALTASVASLRSDKIHFQDLYTQLRSRLDERERYLEQRETMLMESEQRALSWQANHDEAEREADLRTRALQAEVDAYKRTCDAVQQQRLLRVVERWNGASLRSCWIAWRQALLEQKRIKAIMAKVVTRMTNQALLGAFDTWSGTVAENKATRGKLRLVVQRMTQGALVMALQRWVAKVAESKEMRQKMTKIAQRMRNMCVVLAFECWHDHAVTLGQQRATLHRITFRMQNMCVVASFDSWRSTVEENQETRAKMRQIVQRMMQGCLVMALDRWKENVEELKAMRGKMNKVLMRFAKKELVSCFDLWRDTVAEEKEQRGKVRKVLQRMLNAAMVQAWELWKDLIQEKREKEERAHGVIVKMLHGPVMRAWEKWRYVVEHAWMMHPDTFQLVRVPDDVHERHADVAQNTKIKDPLSILDYPEHGSHRHSKCFHTARTQQQLVMDNFHEGTSEEIIVILPKPLGVVLQIGDEQDPIRAGFVVVSSITPGGNVARHGKIAVGDIILSIADPASKTTGLDSSAHRYCADTYARSQSPDSDDSITRTASGARVMSSLDEALTALASAAASVQLRVWSKPHGAEGPRSPAFNRSPPQSPSVRAGGRPFSPYARRSSGSVSPLARGSPSPNRRSAPGGWV